MCVYRYCVCWDHVLWDVFDVGELWGMNACAMVVTLSVEIIFHFQTIFADCYPCVNFG